MGSVALAGMRPVQAMVGAPAVVFLGALAVMLFTPPSLAGVPWDRVAFAGVVGAVVLRALVMRKPLLPREPLLIPMGALALLGVIGAAQQPYDTATWSFLGAKFVAPFAMFYLAGIAFDNERAVLWFHRFSFVVLAYLVVVSVAQFVGATWLVWPRSILDASIGIHADRARGPLLQAVANGLLLNLLGLVALDRYRRGELRGAIAWGVLLLLPIAVLGTMTRAVWVTFTVSAGALLWNAGAGRWPAKKNGGRWAVTGVAVAAVLLVVSVAGLRGVFADRMGEPGPVETRVALYRGAWDMFWDRPLLGWGFNRSPEVLPDYVENYKLRAFWAHNTMLEILLEQGLVGGAMYAWIVWGLWRLGRGEGAGGISARAWRWMVVVYVAQGMFVVLNYQFVNAWMFGMAGIVAKERRRSDHNN